MEHFEGGNAAITSTARRVKTGVGRFPQPVFTRVMARNSSIQWVDTTVTPVAGCDGCPLWPSPNRALRWLTGYASEHAIASAAITRILWNATDAETDTLSRVLDAIERLQVAKPSVSSNAIVVMEKAARREFRCWSGHLTRRFARVSKSYPVHFEAPTLFPGRIAAASLYPPPNAQERANKPWLLGMPRIVFVNDMGDALSANITFESLREEIVVPCGSLAGRRHIWTWVSKRPRRMLEFARWLDQQGVAWPPNLIPMTSPINATLARAATALLEIPAPAIGLSAEPWDVWVDLPKELLRTNTWVILGGESGASAANHPFEISWARRMRIQCRDAGAPYFLKQLGSRAMLLGEPFRTIDRHGGDWDEWPRDLRVREMPAVFRTIVTPALA